MGKVIGWFGVIIGLFMLIAGLLLMNKDSAALIAQKQNIPAGISGFMSVLYIGMGLFMAYYSWQLVSFAKKGKIGITYMLQQELEQGLNHLRRYFKITAIMYIIAMVFYAMIFIAAISGVLVGSMM